MFRTGSPSGGSRKIEQGNEDVRDLAGVGAGIYRTCSGRVMVLRAADGHGGVPLFYGLARSHCLHYGEYLT
jgi:hypothetical protein